MKKYINDPRLLFGAAILFFLITAIDTWFLGATGWYNMYWWSQTSFVAFLSTIGISLIRFVIMPLVKRSSYRK